MPCHGMAWLAGTGVERLREPVEPQDEAEEQQQRAAPSVAAGLAAAQAELRGDDEAPACWCTPSLGGPKENYACR